MQELLDDIVGDTKLLKLTLLTNKVERVRQLFEGVVRELKKNEEE